MPEAREAPSPEARQAPVPEGPPLRLATRGSALALAQSRLVAGGLAAAWPGLEVTLVPVVTEGDRRRDVATSRASGARGQGR